MKLLLGVFPFVFSFIVATSITFAANEFETNYQVRYQISSKGAHVIQTVNMVNKLANVYATDYSLIFESEGLENVAAFDSLGAIEVKQSQKNEQTSLALHFNDKVVGLGKTLTFRLEYDQADLVTKNGQIWEVIVPKIDNNSDINSYELTLAVPTSFGSPASIRPTPLKTTKEKNFNLYEFNKEQILTSGVMASFGQFQIFDFNLSFHLDNPKIVALETEIALPPDMAYQELNFTNIDPKPVNVRVDNDGNWLARYTLAPHQKINIIASGQVKIFAQPRKSFATTGDLAKNLLPQKFWQTQDPVIQEKAKTLTDPRSIYDFVVSTLNYDTTRLNEGAKRFGAIQALAQPNRAICMEFTDLFVTLARAAGIPAREINGFAYTTNSKVRPIGLVSDILHAWPEYYDEKRKLWVQIDPTWGKTTGGVDYFSKTDLNHFTFAIHGESDEYPYPAGSYKTIDTQTKDVDVTFGKKVIEGEPKIEVVFKLPKKVSFLSSRGKIIIKNSGQKALYNSVFDVKLEGLKMPGENKRQLSVLPPYASHEVDVRLKTANIFQTSPGKVIINSGAQVYEQQVDADYLVLLAIPGILASVIFFSLKFIKTSIE